MKLVKTRKVRTLPYSGRVLVEEGEQVSSSQTVAELDYVPGSVYTVPVARILSLPPTQLDKVVRVKVGDQVAKDEVIAVNNVLYQPKACTSPLSGVIGMVSRNLGKVYIRDLVPLDNDGEDVVFKVDEEFGISKSAALRAILVNPGDRVAPRQVLAQYQLKKTITSKVYGQISAVEDGRIVVSPIKINSQVRAFLNGKVAEVLGKDGVVIEGFAYQLQGAYGIGGERYGYLKVVGNADHVLEVGDIDESDADKIIYAGETVTPAALQKANEIGVKGIVTSHMRFADISSYAGVDFVPGITGNENRKTALILVDGFYRHQQSLSVWKFLNEYQGKLVTMSGSTHIRAGAIRPELLLPADEEIEESTSTNRTTELSIGRKVEILRSDWHGRTGQLKEISSNPKEFPSEIKALAAVIDVAGELVSVPLPNIRVKEEESR